MGAAHKTPEERLTEAQRDLVISIAAELQHGDSARLHRAESANTELTFQQRETHRRLYLQYLDQYHGQRNESNRLRALVNQLRDEIEDARMVEISSSDFLRRLRLPNEEQMAAVDDHYMGGVAA